MKNFILRDQLIKSIPIKVSLLTLILTSSLAFSQQQIHPEPLSDYYVTEMKLPIQKYSFETDSVDSSQILYAQKGKRFNLIKTKTDTSGSIIFYIIKFWPHSNDSLQLQKQLLTTQKKLKKYQNDTTHIEHSKKRELQLLQEEKRIQTKIAKYANTGSLHLGIHTDSYHFAIRAKYFDSPMIKKIIAKDIPAMKQTELSFVGAGDIQKSINDGSIPSANTGLGVILSQRNKNPRSLLESYEIDFSINVASTADSIQSTYNNKGELTNKRDFGTYLLLPMNSGQATRLKTYTYLNPERWILNPNGRNNPLSLAHFISGFKFEFVASNRVWDNSTGADSLPTSIAMNAAGFSFKMGIFHDFVPRKIRLEKNFSIRFGVNFSFRGIYGDAGFNNSDTEAFREALLGTKTRQFWGHEFDLVIRIKNIEAKVAISGLQGGKSSVTGLTDTQFVTSISFVGGFPIKLKN
jgi:hypothetical protein